MLKILRQLSKDIWKEDSKAKKSAKNKPRKKKSSTKPIEERLELLMKSLKKEVNEYGSKNITIAKLFNRIGVRKRSSNSVQLLNKALWEHGFHVFPDIELQSDWKTVIAVSQYPIRKLGDLFDKERQLEDYIDKKALYGKLGINSVVRQFSPKGTRDRFDFLGETDGQQIVLELKNKDGGKSAVEQVFRYAGYLKREHSNIRKILVTGVQNRETALAIAGHSVEEREGFEWYLYNYNSQTGDLDFERVSEEQIEIQVNAQIS